MHRVSIFYIPACLSYPKFSSRNNYPGTEKFAKTNSDLFCLHIHCSQILTFNGFNLMNVLRIQYWGWCWSKHWLIMSAESSLVMWLMNLFYLPDLENLDMEHNLHSAQYVHRCTKIPIRRLSFYNNIIKVYK